jgi:hypothetical protein
MTLFAAGHETTANALAWTFYLLSQHPRVLDTLLAELGGVLRGREPSLDDVPRLTYLDGVVTESMRIFPPAWTQGRRAVEPYTLDGYTFPAGTIAMFSQWVIHHLPDVWGDPDVFRPERWDPVHGQKVPSGAYFPFGGGPRMCIGMPFAQLEARLVMATILSRFVPRLVPGWACRASPPRHTASQIWHPHVPGTGPRPCRRPGRQVMSARVPVADGLLWLSRWPVTAGTCVCSGGRCSPFPSQRAGCAEGSSVKESDAAQLATLRERSGRGGAAGKHSERAGGRSTILAECTLDSTRLALVRRT